MQLDEKFLFGIMLTVVGMGLTFLTLGFLAASMHLLKKIFPPQEQSSKGEKHA